ncbi:unnamed protein product [Larinioides sclopetarius]|uniref:Endoplasmic reticulum-Golgi intermediate compartment protein 3 n=1 Tax=Larinioides sclopetarius TaxID=280406 RepID=A0AAV2A7K4_9ARAC
MDDERVEYYIVWRIEDFSYWWYEEKLTSPDFSTVEFEDTSWHMVLYPGGERYKNYVSFYLFRNTEDNGPENVSINYKLSGPVELGSSVSARSEEGNHTFTKGHGREWPRFVKIEEIPYLPRDNMKVKCRIRKGGGKVHKLKIIRVRTRIKVKDVCFELKVENFSTLKPSEKKAIDTQSESKQGLGLSCGLHFDLDLSCEGDMAVEITSFDRTYIRFLRIYLLDVFGVLFYCSVNDNLFDAEEKNIQKLPLPFTRQEILNRKSEFLCGDTLSLLCDCTFPTGMNYDHVEITHYQETGIAVTVISAVIITLLFISELNYYLTPEITEELFVDVSRGEKLRINIDVTFPQVMCDFLSIDAMDVSGEQQINLEHNIYKRKLDENGKPLEKPEKESKYGESQETNATSSRKNQGNFFQSFCSHPVNPFFCSCCNTCEEVQNAYRMRGWAVPDTNDFVQCVREGWSKKLESVDKEGCQIFGYLDVNRVAGNFHIAPGKTFTQHHVHVHDLQPFAASQFNLTHRIRHLSFGHSIPGKTNPLDGTVQVAQVGL